MSLPLTKRFLLFIFLPLTVIFSVGWDHLSASLPSDKLFTEVNVLNEQMAINRDDKGTLVLHAASDSDLYFLSGIAHSQDKLWQMELLRKAAQGRLSELLGKRAVPFDKWILSLNIYQKSHQSFSSLSENARTSLQAYANGVNAYLSNAVSLPVEFDLTGMQPEPWQAADSIAILKFLALQMDGVQQQRLYQQAWQAFFHDQGSVSDCQKPNDSVSETRTGQACIGQLLNDIQRVASGTVWAASQSNEQVSVSMFQDFQSDSQLLSAWYAVRYITNEYDVAGITLPGIPVVLFGQNQHIAWGGTGRQANQAQLFAERVSAEKSSLYQSDSQWLTFEQRDETLLIKADFPADYRKQYAPLNLPVRETIHGPVISDLLPLFDYPVSLAWTGLTSQDTSYEAFFQLPKATNWSMFSDAMAHLVSPAMSMVYIDKEGNIGQLNVGAGFPASSQTIAQGWLDSADSSVEYQRSSSDSVFNPAEGLIVVSGNQGTHSNRITRLNGLLEPSSQTMSPASTSLADKLALASQDTFSPSAHTLASLVNDVREQSSISADVIEKLEAWDGHMNRQSVAASIVTVWKVFLTRQLLLDELNHGLEKQKELAVYQKLIDQVPLSALVTLLTEQPESVLCDSRETPHRETCADALTESLQDSLHYLELVAGSDINDWTLDQLSYIRFNHVMFNDIKIINGLFNRQSSVEGSEDSIKQVSSPVLTSTGIQYQIASAFQQLIHFSGSSVTHQYALATGQSGNVLSEHYDDMLQTIDSGSLHPLYSQSISSDMTTGLFVWTAGNAQEADRRQVSHGQSSPAKGN